MSDERKVQMTPELAEAKLKEWAGLLEVNTKTALFGDVIEQLTMPMMNGRLDFNSEEGTFSYLLIKPIEHTNSKKEMITISEGNFGHVKVIDRFKESQRVEASGALFARHTGLVVAEVDVLCDRDINNINEVIMGFFGRTKSSE